MTILSMSTQIKCLQCKHFQEQGSDEFNSKPGTCRATPPSTCCDVEFCEPCYSSILMGEKTWCSAFLARSKNRLLLTPKSLTTPNLIVDGDMELVGTAKWWNAGNATLTKEAGTPHGGTKCLRVLATAADAPAIAEQALARPTYFARNDSKMIFEGYYRSDGNIVPSVYIDGVLFKYGTLSTDWQHWSVEVFWWDLITTPNVYKERLFQIQLQAGDDDNDMGDYCEFDDVRVTQVQLNSTEINCWKCRHFQPLIVGGVLYRAGECRRPLAAPQCATPDVIGAEPCFPRIMDGVSNWCSAWMLSPRQGIAAPPVVWDPENPPPLFPYSNN